VYGTWGHRSEAITEASHVRQRILPAGAEPLFGIFSHIGATALNGILDSGIRLGETIAVFGLGVVGQLVCQLARLSGAQVIAVDLIPMRLQMAEQLGAHHVLDGRAGSAAEAIKRLTGGRGADICIEASGSTQALNEACRACARDARVVTLGFFQGAAQGLYLGEEFHHNRIQIICSQIGGVAPELQQRWDRLRLVHTFMLLAAEGKLHLRPLITHIVPAPEAPTLFRLLDEAPADVLQAVLDFCSDPLKELSPAPSRTE
jgi:threonine dehydrogenase-like Zn-dependent dehydrogenase